MIFDVLKNRAHYHKMVPGLFAAFDWLSRFSPSLPDGRHVIADPNIFASVQSYATAPPSERRYETHRRYLDIQFIVAGSEVIFYAPVSDLKAASPYYEDRDVQFHAEPEYQSLLHLSAGQFAIFLPEDGHKPGCIHYSVSHIRKVVVKIPV